MKKVQYGPTNMVIYRQVSLKHNIMPQRVNVFFSSTFILCSPYVLYCLCQSRRVCCCPEVPIPPLVLWSPVYMECRNDRHFVLRVRSLSLSLFLSSKALFERVWSKRCFPPRNSCNLHRSIHPEVLRIASFNFRQMLITNMGTPDNVFPLISGGKVALNRLRPLPCFNATFPPI